MLRLLRSFPRLGLCQLAFVVFRFKGSSRHTFDASRAISFTNQQAVGVFKLYVGLFPKDTSEESLKSFYSQFGAVKDVRMVRNSANLHAFVTFVDEHAVQNALRSLPHKLNGVNLFVYQMDGLENHSLLSDQHGKEASNKDFQPVFSRVDTPVKDYRPLPLRDSQSVVLTSNQLNNRFPHTIVSSPPPSVKCFQTNFYLNSFPTREHKPLPYSSSKSLQGSLYSSDVRYPPTANDFGRKAKTPIRDTLRDVNCEKVVEDGKRKGRKAPKAQSPILKAGWKVVVFAPSAVILYHLCVRTAD